MRMISLSDENRIEKIYSAFFKQNFPGDLKFVGGWLAASILAIYLPIINGSPIRVVLSIPLVLFLPGYCLLSALFPKNSDITLIERIALSFGLSVVFVSLIGLGLNFTPWGIRLEPLIISLTLFTWVMILVAQYRRTLLPFEDRFRIPFSKIAGIIQKEIFPNKKRKFDRFLNAALALVIVIAIISAIYVIAFPKEGERFTEFFILGEKQKAVDYPDWIITGQNYPMFIGVGNHEYRNMTYTIETWTSFTEFDNLTNSTTIMVMDPLDQMSLTLAHNETMTIPYNLTLNKTGYNRVEFLLFKETVPGPDVTGSDRINASYRALNLWITVQ
jgi:uncharacterized membrane protein